MQTVQMLRRYMARLARLFQADVRFITGKHSRGQTAKAGAAPNKSIQRI